MAEPAGNEPSAGKFIRGQIVIVRRINSYGEAVEVDDINRVERQAEREQLQEKG